MSHTVGSNQGCEPQFSQFHLNIDPPVPVKTNKKILPEPVNNDVMLAMGHKNS